MQHIQFDFTPSASYYNDLLRHIPSARKRVVIHSMALYWGKHTAPIARLLEDALKRGIEVRIVGDIYCKFELRTRPFMETGSYSWSKTAAINKQLQDLGAHVSYIGKIGINPFKNRCHSKVTLIDDHLWTFGGINFTDRSFENYDYMLHTKNAALADQLYALVRKIEENLSTPFPDTSDPIDPQNTMLFDGGTPGRSIIYETASALAADAKKLYLVSQMCPSGILADRINATDNECYFVTPLQTATPNNIGILLDQARYKIKNLYKKDTYIHAKFILTIDSRGKKHLLSGSNNYSWRGVAYGTKEIALHSTDHKLWDTFYEYMQREIMTP